ncbi:MAG TPA: DUF6541 family protein [Anaerolineae bacterium]|nr:DUF6541 family protein [Anaerolineae bacterium]
MDRRLRFALVLAASVQALLVVAMLYRASYDGYIHMFFADHYRRDWWALQEMRWYTGFSVASYPPLVHQLIALVSIPFGVESAWAIVLWSILTALPSGVYAFARIFVRPGAAGYAAIASAVLPSVFLSAHTFGQLPTLTGLLAILWGLAVLHTYLRGGRPIDGLLASLLMSVAASAHHGALLFMPFGVTAVVLHAAFVDRLARRPLVRRVALFSAVSLAALACVIWPFWRWGMAQTMQTPIDHPSRHNFLADLNAQGLFFWAVYGPLVVVIPFAVRLMVQRKRFVLGALFVLMFTLGLGGTTALPRLLYGPGWAWLTYDRFSLWATITLLPLAGVLVVIARFKLRRKGRRAWLIARAAMLLPMGAAALVSALLASVLPLQPRPIDMQPIVSFLAEGDRAQWRYLTFGFGDQLARLSLLTEATTIDGSYHTARELPELRSSGIGQIDTAYWLPGGLDALDPIIDQAGARGVRWGFVNLDVYAAVLERHGWRRLAALPNGVVVWENPAAVRPSTGHLVDRTDPVAAASWGVLPLSALGAVAGLAYLRKRPIAARRQALLWPGGLANRRASRPPASATETASVRRIS